MGKRSKRGGTVGREYRRGCPCCVPGNKKEDRRFFFGAIRQEFRNNVGEIVDAECSEHVDDGSDYADTYAAFVAHVNWLEYNGQPNPYAGDCQHCAAIDWKQSNEV